MEEDDPEGSAKRKALTKDGENKALKNIHGDAVRNFGEPNASTSSDRSGGLAEDSSIDGNSQEDIEISSRRKNSELYMFEKLQKFGFKRNYTCKNVGYNTFRFSFNNFSSANNFVTNPILRTAQLKAFIPDRFIAKFIVIRNVPISFTDELIREELQFECNDFEVFSVFRFTRREIKEDKVMFLPTQTVKIGFIGENIPKRVRMCGTMAEAELYIPPLRQCKNCGRLGHIADRCKSLKRCLICGEQIPCPDNCKEKKCENCRKTTKCVPECNSPKCILCNSKDHISSDSHKCKKWTSEKSIREIMTISNLSRKEVMEKYPSHNYYEILGEEGYENAFPPLTRHNPDSLDVNREINKRLTKIRYSKVAASIPKRIHELANPITINPSQPTYDYPKYHKVSDFEKLVNIFSYKMATVLKSINCTEGLDILNNFQVSIQSEPSARIRQDSNKTNESSFIPAPNY
ncbi:uncharacterized protein LOC119610335 [Lucilia sericata]|uniref:uncharacterized protein LOC119610335 n=1 Tax=Lucilia sericata TaxID=13632 RepID=UPI0018A84D17|nr:uncharacterized protein LOC119610335 [Lucilia sericata]